MYSPTVLALLTFLVILPLASAQSDWTAKCPSICSCKWVSGKKSANCTNIGLTAVPNQLSRDLQSLDLSGNELNELPANAFSDVLLINLHKLYLRNCHIYEIHKNAFHDLKILIELDLSDNKIKVIPATTFQDLDRLRIVLFQRNRLLRIEEGALSNLKFLQKVDFSENNITYVSERAFTNDPKLQYVVLNHNEIQQMNPIVLNPYQNLTSLVLHDNPWLCDCTLKKLRDWTIARNLYTPPTACKEPPHLRGEQWNEIAPEKFACKPIIFSPPTGATITLEKNNKRTISCKVYGDPVPTVNWILNNRIITPGRDGHFVITDEANTDSQTRWVNLTIRDPRQQDRGELICSASNPGGVEERNISIVLSAAIITGFTSGDNPVLMPLMLGVIIGVLLLFILLVCLFYCLWHKRKIPIKNDMSRTNGGANLDDTEMEKSLITAVNPLTKPPRQREPPASVTSNATEMSEMNRTLLDSDSCFGIHGTGEEDSHSINYSESIPRQLKDVPHAAHLRSAEQNLPPDLLSFPLQASQVSPAGSCASTIPDHSRLHSLPVDARYSTNVATVPMLGPSQLGPSTPQSPLHSPIYGTLPACVYRTLPYSRSHSPFISPGVTPVQSKQGYVTIPRRPRVPSWSSPTPTKEVSEPVYDNLGIRTTADGSSKLSLNKLDGGVPSGASMRGRPLPATPTYQQNGLPLVFCTPINEHESPPNQKSNTGNSRHVANHEGVYGTSPGGHTLTNPTRSSSLQKLSSPINDVPTTNARRRESWAPRTGPEGSSMKRLSPTVDKLSPRFLNGDGKFLEDKSFNSIYSSLSRTPKVPPKPPPKPKKKGTIVTGPLFEDEGEDGTEV